MITANIAQQLTEEANQIESHITRAAKNGEYSVQLVLAEDVRATAIIVLEDNGFSVKCYGKFITISWEIEKPARPTLRAVK